MILELTIALGVAVGCGLGALAVFPIDKDDDDLPALGESIDRAIALAAALPDNVLWIGYDAASPHGDASAEVIARIDADGTRVYLTPQGAAVAAAL